MRMMRTFFMVVILASSMLFVLSATAEAVVVISEDFEGTFYAHFHDWNKGYRSAKLNFCGKDLGPLIKYGGDGVWLKQTISSKMAKLRLELINQL